MMRTSTFRQRLVSSISALAAGLVVASTAGAAWAAEVADALDALSRDTVVSERVSLKALGITTPISLAGIDARYDVYLPIPADVPLQSPNLSLDARYLRGDGGRTTFVVYLDGSAVSARSFRGDEGNAGLDIGVDSAARPGGFVRLGLAWSSSVARELCEEARTIGDILEVSPDTYLDYSYDASAVTTISSAWTALRQDVSLLIANGTLDRRSYDTAWRLGLALERAGKRVQITKLPAVGDTIDLNGIVVPQGLRTVPAFAALVVEGRHTIANEAEIGALLLLGPPSLRPRVAVSDDALSSQIKTAIDALGSQVLQVDPEAQEGFSALIRSRGNLEADQAHEVALSHLSGRPVIVVEPDAGAAAAGLFDTLWRATAQAQRLIVNQVQPPVIGGNIVPLGDLTGAAGNIDLLDRGQWSASIDLASALADGKVPEEINLQVSAAPGATDTRPVVSVFFNDYLLGASRLDAHGQPERIKVRVPDYALLPRNVVRVDFRRQPSSNHCRETPSSFPAAVLPDSYLTLGPAPAARNFVGLLPRLSGGASLFVPEQWLSRPAETLSTIIHIADAGGVSPERARIEFAAAAVTPTEPFIAFDTAVKGSSDIVQVDGDRLILSDRGGRVFYDVAGLRDVAVVRSATGVAGSPPGLIYQSIGQQTLQVAEPFRLSRGNLAVLGPRGVLVHVDTNAPVIDKDAASPLDTIAQFKPEDLTGVARERPALFWGVLGVVVALFLIVLLRARRARRRSDQRQ